MQCKVLLYVQDWKIFIERIQFIYTKVLTEQLKDDFWQRIQQFYEQFFTANEKAAFAITHNFRCSHKRYNQKGYTNWSLIVYMTARVQYKRSTE